ncbi:MAG: HNH endonuclease [Candidatus Tyrphobacter sp.]
MRAVVLKEDALYRIVVMSTDWDWYDFLRVRPEIDEVNFWRPGARADNSINGTPWLFQVRGTRAIWGIAFFSTFSVMPIGVAWDTFGVANGFSDLETFRKKISRLQSVPEAHVNEIGCAVLSTPEYFREPVDVSKLGRMYGPVKSFDARSEEGARLWAQVCAQTQALAVASPLVHGGKGKPVLVVPRVGQGAFRIGLERQYQTRCAVTGERTRPALEAAHIKPFSLVGEHRLANGLLLRSDIHKLFDQGYVTVTPDRRFRVAKAIRDEFENGRDYYALDGREIRDTVSIDARPAAEYLEWHSETIFRS